MRKTLIWAMSMAITGTIALSAAEPVADARTSFTASEMLDVADAATTRADIGVRKLSDVRFMPGSNLSTQCNEMFSVAGAPAEGAAVSIDDCLGARTVMGHVYSSKNILSAPTTVTKVDDTHVLFNNFFYSDITVTAEINAATGEVVLPGGQFIIDAEGIGRVCLCRIDLTKGVFSTTDPIRGRVYGGAIHIEDAYGFFVTEGAEAGKYLNVGLMEYTAVAAPNGRITNNFIGYGGDGSMTQANQQLVPVEKDVYVYPVGTDRVRMMMLPLHTNGTVSDIIINLTSDKKMSIDPQTVYNYSIYGDFNFYGMTEKVDASGKVTYSASILSPVSVTYSEGASTTMSWGRWLAGSTSTGIFSASKGATVVLDSPIVFPSAISTELAGDGSAENPYVIATADNLVALAQRTLNDTGVRGSLKTSPYDADDKYYDVFEGKYFTVTADIDLADLTVAYKPIGNKQYRFAGVVNGNGHTIRNLDIKSYAYDYCSLFGGLGAKGELRNLTVESPVITSLGYGVAGVVAYNAGLIDNVKVVSPRITASKGYNTGGITAFNYGTISNCEVENLYSYSMGYSGGITGRLVSGTVENCHATGNIYFIGAQAFGGGVAGFVTKLTVDSPGSRVADCSFSGVISASNNEVGLGGIAGAFSYSTAERCFANVTVSNASAQSSYIGGLAGSIGESKFTDCYVTGWVRNAETVYAGGLAGHSNEYANPVGTTFTNCYSAAMLSTKSANPHRGVAGDMNNFTFENCYYDAQVASVADETYGRLTSAMTSADGLPGFSTDVWTFEAGLYPRLKNQAERPEAAVAASALCLDSRDVAGSVANDFTYRGAEGVEWKALVNGQLNAAGGHAFTFDAGAGKLNYEQFTDTIYAVKGDVSKYYIVNIAPVLFEGKGTAEEPWLISNTADFRKFAEITVNATMPFAGRHFRLTADLDFGGDTITAVCRDNSAKLAFAGVFDGDGHTVDNFVVCQAGYDADGKYNPKSPLNSYYAGLFANLGKTGVVRNLTVGGKAVVEGTSYVGGLVGGSIGLVENCRNYALVTAVTNYAGGIVGYVKKDTDKNAPGKGVIRGCYNGGKVRANYNSVGGIVGYAVEAIVENCENTGEVTCYNFNASQKEGVQNTAGGIAGVSVSSTYANVVNSGAVSSYKTVGGLFGTISGTAALPSVVTNGVNYGIVEAWAEAMALGQIAGSNTLASFVNCYADRQLQSVGMVANGGYEGVSPVETSVMTSGKMELPSEAWAQAAGRYPTMKYDAVPPQVALNSKAVVAFADKETAGSLLTSAGLSSGVTWEIEGGNGAFAIAGGRLTATAGKDVAKAVLVAREGECRRDIPVSTFDIYILDGRGTAEAPFLIKSAADFITLADFVNGSRFDYAGYRFKVTSDLDFSGMEFKPVGQGGAMFNGDFDGNGMKFENIAYAAAEKTDTYKGLFGTVGSYGTIYNVELAKSSSISAYSFAGGIAGALYGRITGSRNYAAVSTTGATNAGGIAAVAYPGASIENCANYGAVTSKSTVAGGILGGSAANARVMLTACVNEGAVSGTSKVGGIAGSASATLARCTNRATVTASASYAGGIIAEALLPSGVADGFNGGSIVTPQYQGGIVATNVAHTKAQPFLIERCVNEADIAVGAKGYSGGIGGSLKAGVKISDCHNDGDILASAPTTAIRVGGITGDITSTVAAPASIENSYNTGAIRANTLAAGVCAYFSNAQNDGAYVRGVYNTGAVTALATTAQTNAGGLLGNGGSVIVEDCWNSGDIVSGGGYVGGLVGQKNSYITSFSRNFNTGSVTGGNAGIGGLIGYGRAMMADCANYGAVSGTTQVAGLIGLTGPVAATLYTIVVKDSYNAAPVKATASGGSTSNICIVNSSTKHYELGNLYYDADVNAAGSADGKYDALKGLSTAAMCSLDLGDAFANIGAAYPLLTSHAGNAALAFACAKVILAEGDSFDSVTSSFIVGVPEGAVWTSSDNLKVDGGIVTPINKEKGEKAVLTLTAGALTRTYDLILNADTSGIDAAGVDGKTVASTQYYTVDGRRIAAPAAGSVVIERTVYTDGTTAVAKRQVK